MKKTLTLIIAAMMTTAFQSFAAPAVSAEKTEVAQQKKQPQPKKPKKAKDEVKSVIFEVYLHCENCVAKVMDNISRAKGVKDLDISLEHQTVAIKYDASKTSEDALKAAIEKLYPVKGKIEPGQVPHKHDHNHDHHHDHGHQHK